MLSYIVEGATMREETTSERVRRILGRVEREREYSADEEKVYSHLVNIGEDVCDAIADAVGMPYHHARAILSQLKAAGWVRREIHAGDAYYAACD